MHIIVCGGHQKIGLVWNVLFVGTERVYYYFEKVVSFYQQLQGVIRSWVWHFETSVAPSTSAGRRSVAKVKWSEFWHALSWSCYRYFLQPRSLQNRPCSKSPGNSSSSPGAHQDSLGTLRLKIHYTADHVFPSHVYTALRQLILQSAQTEVGVI